jgi:2-dehydro-3-deoxyphosphogluconate aldolase/(4S)-4-hydroxy-2-oxoglutarate aldolase
MDIARFRKLPVLGILRGIEKRAVEPLVETAVSSGLETIEITMNTKDAASLIKQAAKASRKRLSIGAGTVLTMRSLKAALSAGATFIVMPVLVPDVLGYCAKHRIPSFPGALTPQEIYTAWKAGATMVKVFPSGFCGPGYFREIKGPFDDIELLACGGVTPENMKDYFASGASAVSFGASVFRKEWLAAEDFASIAQAIKKFTEPLKKKHF